MGFQPQPPLRRPSATLMLQGGRRAAPGADGSAGNHAGVWRPALASLGAAAGLRPGVQASSL